jgi:FkbM family methyltransferase
MSLPRISRRRRRWLNQHLSQAARDWVEAQDPFYLLADSADIVARSIEIVRGRARLRDAQDRIFCDLGFNNRTVFDQFYQALGPDFRWFGFEVQPKLHRQAMSAAPSYAAGPVEFIHAAAATYDGTISIAIEGKPSGQHVFEGTTTVAALVRDKAHAQRLDVQAVDLARFLEARVANDAAIVIKMDIEGAEYDLLPHLLRSPIGARVELILCEFHWRRFPFPQNLQRLFQGERLISQYRKSGALLMSWR